jgi:hypothetical protein
MMSLFHRVSWRTIRQSTWSWVPVAMALVFITFIVGPWLNLSTIANDLQLFFRSISTAMVSLMGLGLAIVIIATQLSTRYGHIMAYRVFTWQTIFYFTVFIILISYCFLLGAGLYIWEVPEKFIVIQVKAVIIVIGMLLIFLVPYLRWLVILRLNPENTIRQEAKRACIRIKTLRSTENRLIEWPDISEKIKEIRLMDNILVTSIGQVDLLVLNQVIKKMYSLSLEAYLNNQDAIGKSILSRIHTIIMSKKDVEAFTNILMERIHHAIVFCMANPKVLDEPAEDLLNFLTSLGKYALRKNEPIDRLVSVLGEMTNEAISNNLESFSEMMLIALQELRRIMIEEHEWSQLSETQVWSFQITYKGIEKPFPSIVRIAAFGYQDNIKNVYKEQKLDMAIVVCEDLWTLGTLAEKLGQPNISEMIASTIKQLSHDTDASIITEAMKNFQNSAWAKEQPDYVKTFYGRYMKVRLKNART